MSYQYIEAVDMSYIQNYESVFLAGGISNCKDWQKIAADKLSKLNDLTVVNPRRKNWKSYSSIKEDKQSKQAEIEQSVIQINWEFKMIRAVNHIIFWFTDDTIQPITLYELGAALERNLGSSEQKIWLGCHPNYERLLDVMVQSRLVGYGRPIRKDLNKLLDDFATGYKSGSPGGI